MLSEKCMMSFFVYCYVFWIRSTYLRLWSTDQRSSFERKVHRCTNHCCRTKTKWQKETRNRWKISITHFIYFFIISTVHNQLIKRTIKKNIWIHGQNALTRCFHATITHYYCNWSEFQCIVVMEVKVSHIHFLGIAWATLIFCGIHFNMANESLSMTKWFVRYWTSGVCNIPWNALLFIHY